MSTPAGQVGAGMGPGQVGGMPYDPVMDRTPPPRQAGLPEIDDLGLTDFKDYMSPDAFDTFVSLMHWCVHLQNIVDGRDVEWDNATMAVALSPFVGFGNPTMWEGAYRPKMTEHIVSMITRWHRSGRKTQKKVSLPGLFLHEKAADFAGGSAGWAASVAVTDLMADDDFRKQWRMPK